MTQGYCTDQAALIGFLYDDCEPGERERIAEHVAGCADCTAELASLTATRRELSAWAPPPAALGFQIDSARMAESLKAAPSFSVIDGGVGETGPVRVVQPWWTQPLPAWAQAAAAVLIFAAGVGFGAGRTNETRNQAAATAPSGGPAPAVISTAARPAAVAPQDLARLEQQLQAMQAEVAALRASGTGDAAQGVTLAQVKELVAASGTELQKQMVLRDAAIQAARREDLQRIGNLIDPLQRVHAQELWHQGEPAPALGAPFIGLQRNVAYTR